MIEESPYRPAPHLPARRPGEKATRLDPGDLGGLDAADHLEADIEIGLSGPATDAVWAARANQRTSREKLAAGLRGLKHGFRGDSSFFAHTYRGFLIALTAGLLGVGPWAWCLLAQAAALVFIAELSRSAITALGRTVGDADDPRLIVVREIATAGVLVAVTVMAATTAVVLTLKLGELFGWW